MCGKRIEDSDERSQDQETKNYLHLACALEFHSTADGHKDDNGHGGDSGEGAGGDGHGGDGGDGGGGGDGDGDGGDGGGSGAAASNGFIVTHRGSNIPAPNPPVFLPAVGGTAAPSPDKRPGTSLDTSTGIPPSTSSSSTAGKQPSAYAGAGVFGGVAHRDDDDDDTDDGSASISLGSTDTDSDSSSDDDSDSEDELIEYDANGNITKHNNENVYINGKLVES